MAEQCGCFSWVISSICLQMCSHRLVSVLQGIECSSVSEGLTAEKTDCWVNICKSVDDLMCIFFVNAPRLQQLDNCFPRMLYSSKTQEGVCVCVCAQQLGQISRWYHSCAVLELYAYTHTEILEICACILSLTCTFVLITLLWFSPTPRNPSGCIVAWSVSH